jgi:dolichol-phosphate mannosyltransferase
MDRSGFFILKASIIIPAYNEEDTIEESLSGVLDLSLGEVEKEIIVVDDCSTDGTAKIVEAYVLQGVVLIRLTRNRGKGWAIREALKVAKGEIVVIHDADLEYDPRDIPALVAPIANGDAPAAYGSRFMSGARPQNMKTANYIANIILSISASVLFGRKLTDEATCYKAVRTDLLKSMNLNCERFEFCAEVTAKLMRAGHKIVWTDGLDAIWTLLKYRFVK